MQESAKRDWASIAAHAGVLAAAVFVAWEGQHVLLHVTKNAGARETMLAATFVGGAVGGALAARLRAPRTPALSLLTVPLMVLVYVPLAGPVQDALRQWRMSRALDVSYLVIAVAWPFAIAQASLFTAAFFIANRVFASRRVANASDSKTHTPEPAEFS